MTTLPHALAALPGWALPAAGLLALVVLAAAGYALARRTPKTANARTGGTAVEMLLTLTAAGIATGVAVNGMWRVFGDALGFTGPGRVALAGFLEIALMVSAIRARRALRETGTVGVDGAAVWAMAALSAVLAAADAHGLAKGVRFAAPLVAAWLWERGMAADRRAARPRLAREAVAWRWTRARLAVRLGLAEPTHRGISEVDRARRLARLTRARLRLAVLETTHLPRPLAWLTLRPVRAALAGWRLQRHALTAVEHLHLGADPTVTVTIRSTVAAVVGLRQATTPTALAQVDPWTARPQLPAAPAAPAARYAETRCEACGSRPAVRTWARPDAGAPFRLCADCAPIEDTATVPAAPTPTADQGPTSRPAPQRTRRPRTAGSATGTNDTAARVARLRARHPDMKAAEIARRLGVTDRTVRRYLNPTITPSPTTRTTVRDASSRAA
jgi:ribosome-binding protein aMBF1 (putative translation factor)